MNSCLSMNMDNIPFPLKLYNLLEISNSIQNPIIGWLSHGKSFCIFNSKRFEDEIIPEYFKHTRMSSFQRQLNLYGFRRISLTEEIRGSYYHRCFQRGRLDLLAEVRRESIKGNKNSSNENEEQAESASVCPLNTNKKPKISQYREYLNSCAVSDCNPSSAETIGAPIFYSGSSAATPLDELFSGKYCTTVNYPLNTQISSNIIKTETSEIKPNNNYQSFINTLYSQQNIVPNKSDKIIKISKTNNQSAEAVKSIEETFRIQEQSCQNDNYFHSTDYFKTVPDCVDQKPNPCMIQQQPSSTFVKPTPMQMSSSYVTEAPKNNMFSCMPSRAPSSMMNTGMNRFGIQRMPQTNLTDRFKRKHDESLNSIMKLSPSLENLAFTGSNINKESFIHRMPQSSFNGFSTDRFKRKHEESLNSIMKLSPSLENLAFTGSNINKESFIHRMPLSSFNGFSTDRFKRKHEESLNSIMKLSPSLENLAFTAGGLNINKEACSVTVPVNPSVLTSIPEINHHSNVSGSGSGYSTNDTSDDNSVSSFDWVQVFDEMKSSSSVKSFTQMLPPSNQQSNMEYSSSKVNVNPYAYTSGFSRSNSSSYLYLSDMNLMQETIESGYSTNYYDSW